jgi:hypothetical protein
MHLAERVRVVEHSEREVLGPGVGEQGEQATLVVDGRVMLRGNRGRLILLCAKIMSLFEHEAHAGRVAHPECIVLRKSVGAHRRERSGWLAAQGGWLHAVVPFGSVVVTGIWVGGERSLLSLAPTPFASRTQIHAELLNPQSADVSAELVLLASMLPGRVSSRPPV